ncbi:DNA-binding protein [Nocardia aurea]|uniref:DNA-binding protein n=1 Tax=Nocardia aurea TaxID=2144174 RepID=UPI0033A91213
MAERTHRLPPATAKEVAAFRQTTEKALAQERYRGAGPAYMRLGRRIFYDWEQVYAWMDANTEHPGAA